LQPFLSFCLVENQAVKALILEHKQIIINQNKTLILYLNLKVTFKKLSRGSFGCLADNDAQKLIINIMFYILTIKRNGTLYDWEIDQ